MFDIAEWVANLLVLGIGVIIWAVAIFIIAMLVSMASQWIEQLTNKGVFQGSPLSALLFIIYTDNMMESYEDKWNKRKTRYCSMF